MQEYINTGYNNSLRIDFVQDSTGALVDIKTSHPFSPVDFNNLNYVYRYVGQTSPRISVIQHLFLCTVLLDYIQERRPSYLMDRLCQDVDTHSPGILYDIVYEDAVEGLIPAVAFHDLHEAVTGDIPAPIKRLLGDNILVIEDLLDREIQKALVPNESMRRSMNSHTTNILKSRIDSMAYFIERAIMRDNGEWGGIEVETFINNLKKDRTIMELVDLSLGKEFNVAGFIVDIQRRTGCL